jgi:hypothetical protein
MVKNEETWYKRDYSRSPSGLISVMSSLIASHHCSGKSDSFRNVFAKREISDIFQNIGKYSSVKQDP